MSRLGSAVLLGSYEPGTPDWDDARRERIGGSEIAAVLGLSPWESPFSLWWRKRGAIGPIPDNDLLWWGRAMEPVIAARFALEHPELDVRECGTYVHEERDYQLISPDRLAFEDDDRYRLVEIKNAYEGEEWGDPADEDVPVYYRCQVMWSMDVFGKSEAYLVVYFGGGRYREYRIRYDAAEAAILRKRAEEFLDSVREGRAPDIDSHPATYETVRALHPGIDDVDVEVPAEIAEPYLAARAAGAAADEAKALTTAQVADHLGDGRRALYGVHDNGHPRAIATRVAKAGGAPYLRANPLPKLKKEIA